MDETFILDTLKHRNNDQMYCLLLVILLLL